MRVSIRYPRNHAKKIRTRYIAFPDPFFIAVVDDETVEQQHKVFHNLPTDSGRGNWEDDIPSCQLGRRHSWVPLLGLLLQPKQNAGPIGSLYLGSILRYNHTPFSYLPFAHFVITADAAFSDYFLNQSTPVCETLHDNLHFHEVYGNASRINGRGPFFSAMTFKIIRPGTCKDEFAAQNSCHPQNYFQSGSYILGTMDAGRRCSYVGIVVPKHLGSQARWAPWIDTTTLCRATNPESTGKPQYEFEFHMEVRQSNADSQSLCRGDGQPDTTPFLTSADWIEPVKGRRYMCKEFFHGGVPYHVYVVNNGNPPCQTESPEEEVPGMFSSAAPFHDILVWFFFMVVTILTGGPWL